MYQAVTDVSQIRVPVQIIVGAEDKLTPPAISRKMAAALPGARLLELPATGHLSNLENPAAFNACVREFLTAIAR
jgi:pimeloyl-ACP methyl ester carboxylesterase